MVVPVKVDEQGNEVLEKRICTVQMVSRARRIRYSRHFFPEPVKELRARLMAVVDGITMVEQNQNEPIEQNAKEEELELSEDGQAEQDEDDTPNEEVAQPLRRSSWFLWEKEEFSHEVKFYKQRRREALLEALGEVRAEQRRLSGRVISVWAYQRREEGRLAS